MGWESAAVAALGVALVYAALASAVRTFVVPRGAQDPVTRTVFRAVRAAFAAAGALRRAETYTQRDALLALYAPLALLLLPLVWLLLVLAGGTALFWAAGQRPLAAAWAASGSSLLTLGSVAVAGIAQTALAFGEAVIGLFLVALLIAFLPTLYAAFARRESRVTLLESRAGSPPSGVELVARYGRLGRLDRLVDLWPGWEEWFADIEESHTSLAALAFFRSPQPDRSWVTAAGAVLDGAALLLAAVDAPRDPEAALCLRAGYVALRRIAAYFAIPFDPDPAPTDPIAVTRMEFDEALAQLAASGVPLVADRDAAWAAFAGWRVTYDGVLIALAGLVSAPYAPWSSDRGTVRHRPPLRAPRVGRVGHASGRPPRR